MQIYTRHKKRSLRSRVLAILKDQTFSPAYFSDWLILRATGVASWPIMDWLLKCDEA